MEGTAKPNTNDQDPKLPVSQQDGGAGDDQTQEPTQQPTRQQEPPKTLSEEEINDRVSKARAEEKSKVRGKMDKLQEEREAAAKRIQELEEELKSKQTDLDKVRKGEKKETESIVEELAKLREENVKLHEAVKVVAEDAARKLTESELKMYRADKIRESGLKLVELVSGETQEEIDQSIEAAKKREAELLKEARDEAQKKAEEDLKKTLPKPLAPDGSAGRGHLATGSQEREQIASIKDKSEYSKRRDLLLADALEKVGLAK